MFIFSINDWEGVIRVHICRVLLERCAARAGMDVPAAPLRCVAMVERIIAVYLVMLHVFIYLNNRLRPDYV